MHLLHYESGRILLTKDLVGDDLIPPYGILSHTWGLDSEEVTYDEIKLGVGEQKPGYEKLRFCGERAREDGLDYFWVDTCCINKFNNAELSEAINSMFRWYRESSKCYVHLADVTMNNQDDVDQAIRNNRWFTRGWTLQELMAPHSVEFFPSDGKKLGDKNSLEQLLARITGVAPSALRGDPLDNFSVEERMAWADKRTTKKKEDKAYSLLGIFNVFMSPIYGEGVENAFFRLKDEIQKRAVSSADQKTFR